jgi:hypothetical protein
MSQGSHDLSGFDENIVLTNDSQTGLSDKVAEMGLDTDAGDAGEADDSESVKSVRSVRSVRSTMSVKSARSVKSVKSVKSDASSGSPIVVKTEKETNRPVDASRQRRTVASQKLSGKRKLSSSSESDGSSGSSYDPSDTKKTPGGASKKKRIVSATSRVSRESRDIPISQAAMGTRITHVVQTAKNGRVIIEGLCVTKKTGQVFYPQDSIYVFRENDENVDNIKDAISESKNKWIQNGHSAVLFSQTFNGSLPTVIGGFTRGFTKSIFK